MNRSTLARGVSALALTAVLATATACSSTEKSGGSAAAADPVSGTVDIAFFGLAANNTYTQSMFKQAEETAQGMDAKVQFFDGKFDASVQSRQVQDAITSGNYDAFIIMPNDSASILPFAQQAIDAGIKVSSLEYPIGKDPASVDLQLDGLTTQVIEDVVFGAESIADSANRACEVYEGCQVAMLWGSRKLPTDAVKVPAFKDDLDPANKLVAEGDANYLEVDGFNLATDMLQANPDIKPVRDRRRPDGRWSGAGRHRERAHPRQQGRVGHHHRLRRHHRRGGGDPRRPVVRVARPRAEGHGRQGHRADDRRGPRRGAVRRRAQHRAEQPEPHRRDGQREVAGREPRLRRPVQHPVVAGHPPSDIEEKL